MHMICIQILFSVLTNIYYVCTSLITDNKKLSKREDGRPKFLSICVSELEECLQQVLSDVLEVEMKAVYEDLWIEVYLFWNFLDIMQN